jgi:hypothetical protein
MNRASKSAGPITSIVVPNVTKMADVRLILDPFCRMIVVLRASVDDEFCSVVLSSSAAP